jgi:hypothetical protein
VGFNKRKMESERAAVAAKEAEARRALGLQILADAEHLIATWNARQGANMPMLFSPTIGAAIAARHWFLWVRCPACQAVNAIDLRTLDRHPDAAAQLAQGMASYAPVESLPANSVVPALAAAEPAQQNQWLAVPQPHAA